MRKLIDLCSINESEINPADVKDIFHIASDLRDKPSGMGRMFKSMRKNAVDVTDLQQAWQQAGYPTDVRDIETILKDHGFGTKEINKVFAGAFGKDDNDEYNEPVANPAILQIVQYAKKAGIEEQIIEFMKKEYGFTESYEHTGKAVVEDVRKIFDAIVHEERTELPKMIRAAEQTQLGRNKK